VALLRLFPTRSAEVAAFEKITAKLTAPDTHSPQVPEVGWCRLTVPIPVIKAPVISALEGTI